MTIKVGIPRGLMYYVYYPLWAKFFENLEVEVVLSDKTNKKIIDDGVKNCVDEACLPVKIYHGHVINLKDRVDYIFVPRIMSVEKNEFICPKFCGLPEMVKYSIKGIPKLIETTIDFRSSRKDLKKIIYEIGSHFTKNMKKIEFAYERGLWDYHSYKDLIKKGMLPIDILENKSCRNRNSNLGKILLLGHSYTMYDGYISMDVIDKLRKNGCTVITQDSFSSQYINEKANTLDKKMFWTFGRQIIGAGLCAMDQRDIVGVVYLSSFACGLDSVIGDIIERRIRRESNLPFMLLTVDEHTGEAGVNTRIEAFLDMIRWREKNEANFPTHGKHLSIH